jgi:hypothetical protein
MEFFKKFLSNKKAGWYVSVVALLFAIITLIVYTARGGNYLSPVSSTAVTLLVVGIITNVIVLVADFKVLAFLPMAFYAATVAVLLNTEMLYITNVAFGVDGNSFDAAFFTFLVTDVLAMLLSAVAFGMGLSKSNNIIAK